MDAKKKNHPPEKGAAPAANSPVETFVLDDVSANGSPVPWLTSLYHKAWAGPYGNRGYPGNCSGELIKDLLLYFKPKRVLDPMAGSGTCADVCRELGIECISFDIRDGQDACNPSTYKKLGTFDFIWVHPPYWRQKKYTDSRCDLSNCQTVEDFLSRYYKMILHCNDNLLPGGRLAILMGDYEDREAGFVPLVYHTQRLCFAVGPGSSVHDARVRQNQNRKGGGPCSG